MEDILYGIAHGTGFGAMGLFVGRVLRPCYIYVRSDKGVIYTTMLTKKNAEKKRGAHFWELAFCIPKNKNAEKKTRSPFLGSRCPERPRFSQFGQNNEEKRIVFEKA